MWRLPPGWPPSSALAGSGGQSGERAYRRFTSQLAQRYAIVALLTEDLATAAQLTQRHPLKAYDAVQLAVAALRSQRTLTVRQHSLTFVSGDTPLSTAAHADTASH